MSEAKQYPPVVETGGKALHGNVVDFNFNRFWQRFMGAGKIGWIKEPLAVDVMSRVTADKLTLTEAQDELALSPLYIKHLNSVRGKSHGDAAAVVQEIYRSILQREPDPDGFADYTKAINGGKEIGDVVKEIVTSEEARELRVAQLYLELLDRQPDQPGLQDKLTRMKKDNLPLAAIVDEIKMSEEYIQLQTQRIVGLR